ncbi:MAG TPA: ferrous iron transporter B, partial [Gammaproteobacteria bacterium]|nr:ferrous iron transporter B [Gammaproteobacteria bacterium]
GVLAKEVVVGTLDAVYSQLDQAPSGSTTDTEFSLSDTLGEALASIPVNLLNVLTNLTDPLGFNVLNNAGGQDAAAAEQNVDSATFGAMVKRFDGQIGAFAYLLFILLYTPCVAATAAIYREAGSRWMWFALAWSTGMAWSAATLFYQLARFNQHPSGSIFWIITITSLISFTLFGMRRAGKTSAHFNRPAQ